MAITREQISVELRLLSTEFSKGLKKINKDLSKTNFGKFSKNFKKGFDNIEVGMGGTLNQVGKLKGATQRLGQQFGTATKMMQGFRMEFLGIMFGGMLIQRIFQGLIRSAKETFMKISEGATPAGKAITALSAEMTFLRFTVGRVLGEALLPMLPAIIEIVRNIKAWVNENPKLASGLLLAGFLLGLLLFTVGSLTLLISSLTNLFTVGLGGAMAKALGGGVLGFAKLFAIAFLIGILIFAIIDIVLLWEKDWKSAMKAMAIAVLALGAIVAIVLGGVAGLWALVIAVFLAAIVMIIAEWEKLWLGIKKIAYLAWNRIIERIEDGINGIIKAWNFFASILGRPIIPKIDLSGFKADMTEITNEIKRLSDEEIAARDAGPQGITQQMLGFLSPGALDDLFTQPAGQQSGGVSNTTNVDGGVNIILPDGADVDAAGLLDTLEDELRRRQGQ